MLNTALPTATTEIDIETFPNPGLGNPYLIQHVAEEFTSVCPKTGHPDFGTVVLTYQPGDCCIELKAYKLYLQGFRQKGIFYEAVTNEIFETLWTLLTPRWQRLETLWRPHGGIRSNYLVERCQPGHTAPATPLFGFSR